MNVYEYCVFYTGDDNWEGAEVVAMGFIVSPDTTVARMKISREIPADYEDQLDDIEIMLRRWVDDE